MIISSNACFVSQYWFHSETTIGWFTQESLFTISSFEEASNQTPSDDSKASVEAKVTVQSSAPPPQTPIIKKEPESAPVPVPNKVRLNKLQYQSILRSLVNISRNNM
jgi:hypothetical protein